MGDYPGGDTVELVQYQATGAVDSLGSAVKAPVTVARVYGASFETYSRGPVEEQTNTITSHERAWAFLPYVPGFGVPGEDADGNSIAVVIDNSYWVRPVRVEQLDARLYKVQGRTELEYDLDGAPDHVWVVCEWTSG